MKYAVCEVRVSELFTKQVSVPPWEVPVLQAIHGNAVTVLGEQEVDRDPPEPADEYRRLATRYSGNKEEPNTLVAAVYGTYEGGIAALEKAIRDADSGRANVSSADAIAEDLERRQSNEMAALVKKQEREREARKKQFQRLDREHNPDDADHGRPAAPISVAAIEARKQAAREARARFEARAARAPPAASQRLPQSPQPTPSLKK